ncbi:hypothetical protein BGZ60DRAFT_168517 [Tricladium varicosporioides]|nr:hypothetical protein BGZ60DRAFT_168517 [Hymenoscyphus varicosporioides]
MSSSPSEPDHAAPTAPVRGEQGYKNSQDGQNNNPRWNLPLHTHSTSLLTQALASKAIADGEASITSQLYNSPQSVTHPEIPYQSIGVEQRNGLTPKKSLRAPTGRMVMVASHSASELRSTASLGTSPTSVSAEFNLHDLNGVGSLLANHRQLFSRARGRGTSLERTEKEKRVQEIPKGTFSNNPGDTGIIEDTRRLSPTPVESISTHPPTEGVRAEYRSWRDAHPTASAEKTWSIGKQGDSSDHGGQVERSITEALVGFEHNARSRKASHSLGFFKEGLPGEKLKRRDTKSRGRSREGTSRSRFANELDTEKANDTYDLGSSQSLKSLLEGRSPLQSPKDQDRELTQQRLDTGINPTMGLATEKGYFDSTHTIETVSEEQVKAMPPQLLAEIRKHHNLTPGAVKGTSFSRSIPVTESERPKTQDDKEDPVDNPHDEDNSNRDGSELTQVKSADEEDDSGEEQISSALFVPHQTPHESPERSMHDLERTRRPGLDDPKDLEPSQQWLEEHEVPTNEVDDNYLSQETKERPHLSLGGVKQKSPLPEKEPSSSGAQDVSDFENDTHDDGGYTTTGDESGLTDDPDATPTGSLKKSLTAPNGRKPQSHDSRPKPKQPLEAIELIPYRHQVGGHTTMWRFSKRAVCKQLNNEENKFYERVERYHPELLKFLPRYIGVLNVTFEKQTRRKSPKKDSPEAPTDRQAVSQNGSEQRVNGNHANVSSTNGPVTSSSQPEQTRVISQSLQSSLVPIPTVTFADNRHIIPSSFLQSHPHVDLQHRSKSEGATGSLLRQTTQTQPPLPNSEFTFRPTLSDKHAVSWGATTVNKKLRNEVFDEAFLQQPIPIQRHRRPASQHRSLPNRHGPHLRASNSESSLKTAQQTSIQPAEESIHRKALKMAAEQRLHGQKEQSPTRVVDLSSGKPGEKDEVDVEFDGKAGTSAPEPEITRAQGVPSSKRQRRYSSGGLRRKPTEVAEGRGNLKYFEEADDAGYKGDVEDVFAMDLEPSDASKSHANSFHQDQGQEVQSSVRENLSSLENGNSSSQSGGTAPRYPTPDNSNYLNGPRPVNPKQAQTQQGTRVEFFLLLEDLTAGMRRPCIMDLKMGTRQYGVEANEKKQMSQRRKCEATTSRELGVRVCGLQVWDVKTQSYIFQDKYFGRDLKAGRQFQDALTRFLYDGVDYSSVLRHIPSIIHKLSQLEVLIRGLIGYRFYAASLLMFYDGESSVANDTDDGIKKKNIYGKGEIDFKIADFANCVTKEDSSVMDRPCPPRHPDAPDKGFLRGLRSLKEYFLRIQEEIMGKGHPRKGDGSMALRSGTLCDGADEDDEGSISY